MNRDDLLKKLEADEALTEQEMLALERFLAESAPVKSTVQQLREDELSLSWRSELNEKLVAMSPKPKRSWAWFKPAAALACAGALALVAFMPKERGATSVAVSSDLERELVSMHRDLVTRRTVTEAGVTLVEARSNVEQVNSLHEWSEADLGTL